jgi:hypothetical protein
MYLKVKAHQFMCTKLTLNLKLIELSFKSSKESTKPMSLLKTRNKVVEVG